MTDFVDLEMSSTENPHNVIVPLLLPSDIPMGVEGQIYNMEDAMDTRPFTPVDTFIRNATGKSFSSEVLIKVKWEEITTANEVSKINNSSLLFALFITGTRISINYC